MLILVLLSLSCVGSSAVKVNVQTKHQTHEALQVDVARNDPVDGGEVEFGLHISARNGVKITAKKLVKKMIPSGDFTGSECTVKPPEGNNKEYSFTMRGLQTSGTSRVQLRFTCKDVTFQQVGSNPCVCDFTVRIDQVGYIRRFTDTCKPAYCLTDNFDIHGGYQDTTNDFQFSQRGYIYYAACDDKNDYCASWGDFKRGFQNVYGDTNADAAYGTQGGHGYTRTYGGNKWFFALVVKAKDEKNKETVKLDGRWVPSSSGGQASFSESMHWEEGQEKASTSSVENSFKGSVQYSYAGFTAGVSVTKGWSSSAAKTNSDTNGGDRSRTCAAYKCEGGTTWQWQMKLKTSSFKTQFDNCIFVCTPNQGSFPKCPFGTCCTSEDRKDECSTCSRRWCDPKDDECPLNPSNSAHRRFCGTKDDNYIDFLKMLRDRVETAARVAERENENFEHLQGERKIDERALRGYQQLYKDNFQLDFTEEPDAKKIRDNVRSDLRNLTAKVLKKNLKEFREYLRAAHDQNNDFDYEQAKKQPPDEVTDPCAKRKGALPGSQVWCLCNEAGRIIRWMPGDDMAAVQTKAAAFRKSAIEIGRRSVKLISEVLRKPANAVTDDDVFQFTAVQMNIKDTILPSDCYAPHLVNSGRFEKCIWKGSYNNGQCCSKSKGCHGQKNSGFNREFFKIRGIDLSAEDFSREQLIQANKRLRMKCYYKVETESEIANRIRRTHNLKITVETVNYKYTFEQEKQQEIIEKKERDKLFLCFKTFYETNKKTKFSLQNIDRMLLQETASCEDRLVNRNCMTRAVREASDSDPLDVSAGGKGDGDGGDNAEAEGADAEKGENNDDRKCCLHKGKKKPYFSNDCNDKEGDEIKEPRFCMNPFKKKEDKEEDKEEDKKKEDKEEDKETKPPTKKPDQLCCLLQVKKSDPKKYFKRVGKCPKVSRPVKKRFCN